MVYSIIPPLETLADYSVVKSPIMNMLFFAVTSVYTPTSLRNCYMITLSTAVMHKEPSYLRIQDVIYQHPKTVSSTFCSICRLDIDVDTTQGEEVGGESSSHVF